MVDPPLMVDPPPMIDPPPIVDPPPMVDPPPIVDPDPPPIADVDPDPPPMVDPPLMVDPPPMIDPPPMVDPPPIVDPDPPPIADPQPITEPRLITDPSPIADPPATVDPPPIVDPLLMVDPPPVVDSYPPPLVDPDPPPYNSKNTSHFPYGPPLHRPTTQTTTFVAMNAPDFSPSDDAPATVFTTHNIRMGFIRKVFAILSIHLLIIVGFICLFLFAPAFERAGKKLSVYIPAYVFLAFYLILICFKSLRRSHPCNLILLSFFTLSLSYLLGVISSFHETSIPLIMMVISAAVTISVCIFTFQTKWHMTKLRGVLFVCALVVFFALVFSRAFLLVTTSISDLFSLVENIAIGGALALLLTVFMVFDIQYIMEKGEYNLGEEEYVFIVHVLYVELVTFIFVSVCEVLRSLP